MNDREDKILESLDFIDEVHEKFVVLKELLERRLYQFEMQGNEIGNLSTKINQILSEKYVKYLENCKSLEKLSCESYEKVVNKLDEIKLVIDSDASVKYLDHINKTVDH